MAKKYHVGKNGPGVCSATVKACPLGGAEVHFDNMGAAKDAYEKTMANKFPAKGLSKNSPSSSAVTYSQAEVMEELGVSEAMFDHYVAKGRLKVEGDGGVTKEALANFRQRDYLNGFTPGKHEYADAVIAFAQRPRGEDGEFPSSVRIIVPGVKKLTDKRRRDIGRQAWEFSGKDIAVWDEAGEREQLRWANTHMGRYHDVEITVKNGDVGWTTSTSGSSYDVEDVALIKDYLKN